MTKDRMAFQGGEGSLDMASREKPTTSAATPKSAAPEDRYARLRTIPDYLEGRTVGSAYLARPAPWPHPYEGSPKRANEEYAADLRALLDERDALAAREHSSPRQVSQPIRDTVQSDPPQTPGSGQ